MTEQDDSDGGTTDSGTNGEPGGGDSTQTVSIGVLQPRDGDLKYYGDQSLWGFLSGLAHKGDTHLF